MEIYQYKKNSSLKPSLISKNTLESPLLTYWLMFLCLLCCWHRTKYFYLEDILKNKQHTLLNIFCSQNRLRNGWVRGHSNNTWHFGGGGVRDCVNKRHKGEGRYFQKCRVTFFWQKIDFFHSLWRHFRPISGLLSVKNNLSQHTGGGGDPCLCHQMTQGGGESKIGQKSVTYYLNGP